MLYSMGGAARAVGLHKATIHRAIKSGKLSAVRNADGTYSIEPVELARVYGGVDPATGAPTMRRDDPQPAPATGATLRDGGSDTSVELVAELRAELAREREAVDDLRRRLDVAEDRVTRLLAALPAPGVAPAVAVTPPPPAAAPTRGFLARLLGR